MKDGKWEDGGLLASKWQMEMKKQQQSEDDECDRPPPAAAAGQWNPQLLVYTTF
jgi:hypothetical protein